MLLYNTLCYYYFITYFVITNVFCKPIFRVFSAYLELINYAIHLSCNLLKLILVYSHEMTFACIVLLFLFHGSKNYL